MIRYNYNQQIAPPAPLVHVTIRSPYQETAVSETTADITGILGRVTEELHWVRERNLTVRASEAA